jgi:N-acyl-D-amino-acid deacylase
VQAERGVLAPGMRADVNVIDPERLALLPPELVHDLPARGRRLLQRARGYVATFVAGTAILEHDELTGALPGKLIRGPQAAPSSSPARSAAAPTSPLLVTA